MKATNVMTGPVIACRADETLNCAAQKMWDADVGVVAIVDGDGRLVGMLTDRDVCMAAYTQGRPLSSIAVQTAMSKTVFAVPEDASVGDIERLMSDKQIHRIPVVDANGAPVGIVSVKDLALHAHDTETPMRHGPAKITRTLAAICQRRPNPGKAA